MNRLLSWIALAVLLGSTLTFAFEIQSVRAATIIVPDDYPTIQEAINHATEGDTISVGEGTYHENVVVNKTVVLTGKNRSSTIIDGGKTGTVLEVAVEKVVVRDFTLRNSGPSWPDSGILIKSDENNISNNTVESNEHGILLYHSSGNILRNNHMTKNRYSFGVWAWQPENVSIPYFVHDIDVSNTVNGKPIYYFVNQNNLVISPGSFPEIGYLGIVNSTNIAVEGVKLKRNFQGALFAYTTNSSIRSSDVSGNSFGINLFSSSNITVEDNVIEGTHGIQIHSSSHSTISYNDISAISGINLEAGSTANTIVGNTLTSEMFGMYVGEANGNTLYHNNFINNPWQVYSYMSMNTWDEGYPYGGNYWSDYTDVDLYCGPNQDIAGSDGIWDHPYVINANNMDRYPLVKPFVPGNLTISIYTGKYTYHVGDTMHLELKVTNPDSVKYVCFAVWCTLPGGSSHIYTHKHSVILPIGLDYANSAFESIVLPSLPLGKYTWHAAFLDRTTHTIIVEDTAEWEFS